MTSIVALIPARAGSRRIVGKNTRVLAGHPLLAYAIATALEAEIFSGIVVSSDDEQTLDVAERYGASTLILRPAEMATDYAPDIQWVNHAMEPLVRMADAFCILRPTSPFRRGSWVRSAWQSFQHSNADSLRAMRPCGEHPGKMWVAGRRTATPVLPWGASEAPWHSMPTQELPQIMVQTAALEMAWTSVLPDSISGESVMPWTATETGGETVDLNTPADWEYAERAAADHPEWLPSISVGALA